MEMLHPVLEEMVAETIHKMPKERSAVLSSVLDSLVHLAIEFHAGKCRRKWGP